MNIKNYAMDFIKERMEKLEQKEDIKLNDDFRYGFTIGFLDAFDFAEEMAEKEKNNERRRMESNRGL